LRSLRQWSPTLTSQSRWFVAFSCSGFALELVADSLSLFADSRRQAASRSTPFTTTSADSFCSMQTCGNFFTIRSPHLTRPILVRPTCTRYPLRSSPSRRRAATHDLCSSSSRSPVLAAVICHTFALPRPCAAALKVNARAELLRRGLTRPSDASRMLNAGLLYQRVLRVTTQLRCPAYSLTAESSSLQHLLQPSSPSPSPPIRHPSPPRTPRE